MSALAFEDVSLGLGGRDVLSGVEFAVEDGEFIAVLGPNGSGKTTLMRAALGLVPPRSGKIRVLGREASRGNPRVGYMPQVRATLGSARLTGWDFVACAVAGDRFGLPHLDALGRKDVERALDLVGARGLAHRPLNELSGGERQRLLLSQALLGRPRLLLLDEPLISLDPGHQRAVVDLVRRLQQELGIAVLFSAHELNPLLGAVDRVLYLGNKRAVLGAVEHVVTGPVLSRLYGCDIDVVRIGGRIFVLADAVDVEHQAHRHEHDGAARAGAHADGEVRRHA